LVFQLALQFLGLGNFANSLVEIVLVYGITFILDGEKPTGEMLADRDIQGNGDLPLGHDISQISSVEPIAHLHNALKVNLSIGHDRAGVDLQNLQSANLIW
jgi:hypothetical protein